MAKRGKSERETAVRRRRAELAERPREEPLKRWEHTVKGGGFVTMLQRTLERFRAEDATNAHANRELFLDDVFVAYLLAFFNPSIRSLRTIEDFSRTQQAQRHLNTPVICRSTLSDFNQTVNPERLAPIITELRGQLQRKFGGSRLPTDLQALLKQILAVDGTFFAAAADVAWAVGKRNQHAGTKYRARVDVHLDVNTWLPEVVAVPEAREGEAERATQAVKPGAIHLYDRAYGSFELIAAHYHQQDAKVATDEASNKASNKTSDKASNKASNETSSNATCRWQPRADFIIRGKNKHLVVTVEEERKLTGEQRALGFQSDRIGVFQGSPGRTPPPVRVREIVLLDPDGEPMKLLTNMLDLPAEIIGELYRHRWQIELFFRWLKCYAQFDHLISHDRRGVLLHFYVTIIGVILMYLHTGFRPSKYALALLGVVAQGGSDLEDILPILRERERQSAVARASAAKRRAKKKAEGR